MRKTTLSFLWASVVALISCLPGGVAADTDASANSLFVQAVQGWQDAEELSGNDTASARLRVEKLKEVEAAIDIIISKHSGSNLAVQLVIGETVGPLSVPMLKRTHRDAELRLKLNQCADEPTVRCVIEHASNIVNEASSDLPSFYLRDIAVAQAQAEFYDESLQTIEGIKNSRDQEDARSKLSTKLAEAGHIVQALDVASHLSIETSASGAFKAIVLAQIESGNLQEAEQFFDSVVDQDDHRRVLGEYAKALASEGQLAKSLDLLDKLSDVRKSIVMNDISANQVSIGDYHAAWEMALKIPKRRYFCEAAVRIGLAVDDHEFIQEIEKMTWDMRDVVDKRSCLRTLGIQMSRPDLLAEARQLMAGSEGFEIWYAAWEELDAGLIEAAYRTALTEEAVGRRSELLLRVAIVAIEVGQVEFAERILPNFGPTAEATVRGALWSIDGRDVHISRLRRIANEIEDDYFSGQSAVHSFILQVHNVDRLERAAEIAAEIPNVAIREGAISTISTEYARAGSFSKALECLKHIETPGRLVHSLLDVAAEMK